MSQYELTGTQRKETDSSLAAAIATAGAFLLPDAGIPAELILAARATTAGFFDRPLTEKDPYRSPEPWQFRGYRRSKGSLDRKASASDLCETFTIGPVGGKGNKRFHDHSSAPANGMSPAEIDHFYASNIWPDDPPDFREQIEKLYMVLDSVGSQVASFFDRIFPAEPGRIAAALTGHVSELAVNYYPPAATPAQLGQMRRGAHRDYDLYTVLVPDYQTGGLEVADDDGNWRGVDVEPASIVVILGQLLPLIVCRKMNAPLHRVLAPQADHELRRERVSFAFFVEPAPSYRVDVPGPDGPSQHRVGSLVLDQIAGLVPAELR